MRIKTKILIIETDVDQEKITEYWDRFEFDPKRYVAHYEHDHGSLLYLSGSNFPFIIQLSFDQLSKELDFLNTFEFINLN